MGVILFALLALCEIALAAFTCARQSERALWYRNSTVARLAELVLVLAMMLWPGEGQPWRFAIGAAVLAVRFVIDLVFFLSRRKKAAADGTRKPKRGVIASCIAGIVLMGASLVPAFVFTGYGGLPTTGIYDVARSDAILLDQSRAETFEADGSCREVPVHFYYPDADSGSFPLVVFNHGSFGYNESNYSTYCELASNGYVVVSVENPHYSLFCTDSSGNLITVDQTFIQQAIDVQNGKYEGEEGQAITSEWMTVRCADENFALDSIIAVHESGALDGSWFAASDEAREGVLRAIGLADVGSVGLFGHSIGGAVAVELGRERADVDAVIDLDGTMLGEIESFKDGTYTYVDEPYPIPLLALDNDEHGDSYSETYADGTPYVNAYVIENAVDGEERSFEGTDHMNFTDLPLLSPTLAKMFGMGDVDPETFTLEMNAAVLDFFDKKLGTE